MSDISMTPIPAPTAKKRSLLVPLLLVVIAILIAVIGVILWHNRPIRPVVLSAEEKAALEMKISAVQTPPQPTYEKGGKDIIITERELNGLLNENTQLGDKLKFELVNGAVHARLETDLDPDLPLVGGRHLKARARFFLTDQDHHPRLVLDDLTIWGISLPNEWLGGIKGRDLFTDVLGLHSGKISGVEEFAVESGQIRIHLAE
jgi:hypothetical protein